jgi:exosome complex component MTR3
LEQAITPSLIFDKLIKKQISVDVLVLENDGTSSCLASAITCVSLSLIDAQFEMYDMVTGCACAFIKNVLFVDPDQNEELLSDGVIVIGAMTNINQISHIVQTGNISQEQSVNVIFFNVIGY